MYVFVIPNYSAPEGYGFVRRGDEVTSLVHFVKGISARDGAVVGSNLGLYAGRCTVVYCSVLCWFVIFFYLSSSFRPLA
jgi:hypothetical protein